MYFVVREEEQSSKVSFNIRCWRQEVARQVAEGGGGQNLGANELARQIMSNSWRIESYGMFRGNLARTKKIESISQVSSREGWHANCMRNTGV